MIQLRIYHEYLECVRALRAVVRLIQKYDCDLGRQLRRAMASVTLNVAEACGLSGGNRRLRFESALGSLCESLSCLDHAEAMDDIRIDTSTYASLDHVAAVLWKLSRK